MLELHQVSRHFGTTRAVDSLDLRLDRGQVVGFLGKNGAGKSTTMRMIVGVLEPDAGDVRWDGSPLTRQIRRQFGYMPEERGLYPKMTVEEQLSYFATLYGLSAEEARRAAGDWLERLDLQQYRAAPLMSLSLGNQQRVQLAAALVHRPSLLVLDEPFSGLDPGGIEALSRLLRESATAGTAILFSSHQVELLERTMDSVLIIDHGRLVAQGSLEDIRRQVGGDTFLEIGVTGAPSDWPERLGVVIVKAFEKTVLVDPGVRDANDLLRALTALGTVTYFGQYAAPLTDLYRRLTS